MGCGWVEAGYKEDGEGGFKEVGVEGVEVEVGAGVEEG